MFVYDSAVNGDNDTTPDADRVQRELLRRAGPARRATMASDLTNQAIERARAGIARAHPELSLLEQRLLFVEVHYGAALATQVRQFVRARASSGQP